MELSNTIASMAVVLGVVLAAGFAVGENNASAPTKTVEKKSLDEQQKQREQQAVQKQAR